MGKTDFDILKEMSNDCGKCIRSTTLVTEANKVKQGGKITFGVDEESVMDIINGTHIAVVYIIDKDKFFKLKGQ